MPSLCLGTGPNIEHRIAQAEEAYARWKPILQKQSTLLQKRLSWTFGRAFSWMFCLSATWLPTKTLQKRLDSFGARICSKVAGLRRIDGEDAGQWWRRFHREGHRLLRKTGDSIKVTQRKLAHRLAGHAARAVEGLLRAALRTRCLAWWRYSQARHECRQSGVHPARFHIWRWEAALAEFYRETEALD